MLWDSAGNWWESRFELWDQQNPIDSRAGSRSVVNLAVSAYFNVHISRFYFGISSWCI